MSELTTDEETLGLYSDDYGEMLEARPLRDGGVAIFVKRGEGLGNRIELTELQVATLVNWLQERQQAQGDE